jgi:hypothetical protein
LKKNANRKRRSSNLRKRLLRPSKISKTKESAERKKSGSRRSCRRSKKLRMLNGLKKLSEHQL